MHKPPEHIGRDQDERTADVSSQNDEFCYYFRTKYVHTVIYVSAPEKFPHHLQTAQTMIDSFQIISQLAR